MLLVTINQSFLIVDNTTYENAVKRMKFANMVYSFCELYKKE